MIQLYNDDNIKVLSELLNQKIPVDCVYGDMIYENPDFSWVDLSYELLNTSGIFYVQLDYHLAAEMKIHLDYLFGKENFINWITVKFEWGGRSLKRFSRKSDFVLMYSKGKDYKFYSDRILIPKKTAGTKLDKRGDGLKIPCDSWDDMSFSTLAKERIKLNGKNVQWQKSLKMLNRLLLPVTDVDDLILDPFMGVGSVEAWAKINNRNAIGIENNPVIFSLAEERLNDKRNFSG